MEDLIEENKLLKQTIDELTSSLHIIQHQVNEMKRKQEYIQMIIALNDMSLCFSLGYKIKNESFKLLNEDARIHGHYIDHLNESGELKRAKMMVLYNKIKYMVNCVREKINEMYPNVIHTVIMELIEVDLNRKVSNSIMKRVYEWWN